MSTISTFLDPVRQADLALDPDWAPHARKAVNMPAAEAAYAALHKALKARDAKNDDDDIPSLEEATEQVLWAYCCTPAIVSDWLVGQCCTQNDPIPAGRLVGACAPLTAGQALVLLMTGPRHTLAFAAMRLRELFEDDSRPMALELAPAEIEFQISERSAS